LPKAKSMMEQEWVGSQCLN